MTTKLADDEAKLSDAFVFPKRSAEIGHLQFTQLPLQTGAKMTLLIFTIRD
jgi:hypothetical protein